MKIFLSAKNLLIRVQVARGASGQPIGAAVFQPVGDRGHDRAGNFILKRKDIDEIAVIAIGPQMLTGNGIDQLRGDANAVAGLSDRTLENNAHAKRLADLADIDRPSAKNERGVSRDNEQRLVAGQLGYDVLGDPVGEELLLGVARHVRERQHGDRGLVGKR